MFICGATSNLLNHGMKYADYVCISIGMCIFGIFILICKDHYIGMDTNTDSILVSLIVVCCEVYSQSLVTEDLIVVNQKVSVFAISELILWSFS